MMSEKQDAPYSVISLKTVDSTNRYLKDYVKQTPSNQIVFCTTEQQTAGYGQQSRAWLSNSDSVLFSFALPIQKTQIIYGSLSLNFAIILHQCLTELTQQTFYLKWPNDLYNHQGKVAGILIEQVNTKEHKTLIIGMGINRHQAPDIEQASASANFDKTTLFDLLFEKLSAPSHPLNSLDPKTTPDFLYPNYWQQHDWFRLHSRVKINTKQTFAEGIYLGINTQGQAEVEINNTITPLSSGLESMRKMR